MLRRFYALLPLAVPQMTSPVDDLDTLLLLPILLCLMFSATCYLRGFRNIAACTCAAVYSITSSVDAACFCAVLVTLLVCYLVLRYIKVPGMGLLQVRAQLCAEHALWLKSS